MEEVHSYMGDNTLTSHSITFLESKVIFKGKLYLVGKNFPPRLFPGSKIIGLAHHGQEQNATN